MRNVNLLKYLFILITFFGFYQFSFGLSYNGINTVTYPPIKSINGSILSNPVYNSYGTITTLTTVSGTIPQYSFTQLGCFDYKAVNGSGISLSGVVFKFVAPWESQITASLGGNYDLRAPVDVVATYIDDQKTRISLRTNNYNSVGGTTEFDLMDIPTYPNSLGGDTSRGVFCVSPQFWLLPRYQQDEGIYLHSVRYSFYHGSTGVFGYSQKFYTGFGVRGYKFADFSIMPGGPNDSWHSFSLPFFGPLSSTSTGTMITWSSSSGSTFESNIGGSDIDRFMGSTIPTLYTNCGNFTNGVGGYANNCYSTGFTSYTENTCYTLQDGRDPNTQWITLDANDTYWWKTTACSTPFINTSLPVWFASDYSTTGSINTGSVNTGSTNTGSTNNGANTDFSECSSFIDVGCFIQVGYNKVATGIGFVINPFKTLITDLSSITVGSGQILYTTGSIFNTGSGYGEFTKTQSETNKAKTCKLNGLWYQYDLGEDFIRFKSDISIFDTLLTWVQIPIKVLLAPIRTIISIFSNVYSPDNGDEVCMLGIIYEVQYQSIFFVDGTTPSIIGPLQGFGPVQGEPTLFDYILLTFAGFLSLVIIIFYLNLKSS